MKLNEEEKVQLAEENIRYIHYFAKKYHKPQWNYDDLFSAASFGMTQALNTFDKDKGIKFSTYSARCITNAIFMFMRKEKRHLNNVSIDQPITTDKDGQELTIMDTLSNQEPENDFDWREISPVVNKVLKGLPERKRQIMILFFENKTQKEIGQTVGLSQTYVSRIIGKVLKKIKKEYWRGDIGVTRPKLEMTVDEFVNLRYEQNLSFVQISKMKGVSDPTIHHWKNNHVAEIEEALKRLQQKEPNLPVDKPKEVKTIQESIEVAFDEQFSARTAEYERLIQTLKDELREASSQLKQKDELIQQHEFTIQKLENRNTTYQKFKDEIDNLQEENQAMRALIKKWA